MKNVLLPSTRYLATAVCKSILVFSILMFSLNNAKAQVINEGFEDSVWTNFNTGAGSSFYGQVVFPNVPITSTMSYLTGSTSFTTALNTCNNSGTWYYSRANSASSIRLGIAAHSLSHSIRISSSGYIITPQTPAAVVNITFWANNLYGMIAGLATDPNAGAPNYITGGSVAPVPFTYASSSYTPAITSNSIQSFSFGGTFSGPCRFGIFNSGGGTIYIDDIQLYAPTGTPPTIITGSAIAGITNAQITGTITPGTLPLLATGIIWSTSLLTGTISDTLQFKTKEIAATGSYTDILNPLLPSTKYYAEAYTIGLDGSFYAGSVIQFTTKSVSTPVVVTGTATTVLSYSATTGGSILDSGGCSIIKKGIVWGTSVNPVAGTANQTIDGLWGTAYSSVMKSLLPGQLYHYRAYAINSCFPNTVVYGNDSTFTTLAAVPSLVAIPGTLDFGNEFFNTAPVVLSYILKGYDLKAGDSITINAPVGYTISLLPNGNYNSSFTIYYTGTSITKTIYVKFSTTGYGVYTGQITHSGGGATLQNADVINLTGTIIQSPDQLTNMGTDFWAGFGYEENMKTATTQFDTTTGSAKGAHLTLYIATGNQPANVVVDLPGLPGAVSFPRTITIAANSVSSVDAFPEGDGTYNNPSAAPDTRLYSTGVSSRGIHVFSTNGVPVSCWLHDWATNNSAGGAMLFPTNIWNSSYTVQAYGGTTSNTGIPNSYFFVIANDDNTLLTINPTGDIIDSASSPINTKAAGGVVRYPQGIPFTILLPHKGDIFNAMGMVDATTKISQDLTGTTISTDCNKKIAVFGGNGRTLINTAACSGVTAGSDNLIQQMLPKSAWGTKYLTAPTKNMEFNMFRVSVLDTATVVNVNGMPVLAANYPVKGVSWNAKGSFYEFSCNQPLSITGNKPISVTQFIMSGTACGGASVGNVGTGDPEMILSSSVQQAINSATVFCPGFKVGTTGGAYINVIIPSSGVSSFTIDGKTANSTVDTGSSSYLTAFGVSNCLLKQAFKMHPGDTSYRYAKFHVSYPATHTFSSNVPFNSIAYGESQGESWGFNAGTAIKNLSAIKMIKNPYGADTSRSVIHTCINNPVTLQIALPYLPNQVDSIVWTSPANPSVAPANTSNRGAIMVDPNNSSKNYADTSGMIVVDGQTYYIYTCPVQYQFSNSGYYLMTATAYGSFASSCAGIDAQQLNVQVGKDNINFTAIPIGCSSTGVYFTDNSTAMTGTYITKRIWNFGDGSPSYTSIDSTQINPVPNPHIYPGLNTYTAYLNTVNSKGCNTRDSININLSSVIKSKFSIYKHTVHTGETVLLTDSSSANANIRVVKYGDGLMDTVASTTGTLFIHTYTNPGTYTVTLQAFTVGGCPGNIYKDTIVVNGSAIVTDTTRLNGCNSIMYNNIVYTNSTILINRVKGYLGFDSVDHIIMINIVAPKQNNITLTGCNSVTYNSIIYTTSTTVKDTVRSIQGCDSIYNFVTIIVSLKPVTDTLTLTGCSRLTYEGIVYNTSTIKIDTIRSTTGCDSIYIKANIVIYGINPVSNVINRTGCNSVVYNGIVYTSSFIRIDTVRSLSGCDSIYNILNIQVTNINASVQSSYYTGCKSVIFKGKIYTASTIFIDTVRSIIGCDSIYNVVNITINTNQPKTDTMSLSGCGNVIYKGVTYNSSTILTDTVRSYNGCDSIINIVNIVITNNSISGGIYHPTKGYIIPNVSVLMSGSNTMNTSGTGSYNFNCLNIGSSGTIRLSKNNDVNKSNGVTALDIALTQSHILGKTLFNTAFKLIAADVNGDGKVTALDIVYMKRLILGIDSTFTNNTNGQKRLWTFLDSSNYSGNNTAITFPIKDSISFTSLNATLTNQTFVGCKLGDVNQDWNPAIPRPMVNNVNAVELSYPSVRPDRASDGYVHIPVKVKNFKDMVGMQFTISFDPTMLQWQGMGNNPLEIETGTNHAEEGSISFLWVDQHNNIKTLEDSSVIMELVFKTIKPLNNATLDLNGSITAIVAYDKDYSLHNVVMNRVENSQPLQEERWSVAPNPTEDGVMHVQMNLKDNKIIVFRLTDNAGRILLVKQVEGVKGSNNIILKEGNIAGGTYYLQAVGVEGVKQIQIR